MYENYWQLERRPFENAAVTDFYYPSEAHHGAQLKLRYTVENQRGGAALSGASGLGKSLVISNLLRDLPERFQPQVHIVFPQMPADQLLAFLATEVASSIQPPTTLSESITQLRNALRDNSERGQHAVIAVDEAHLLEDRQTLEALRLLLNFESDGMPQLTLLMIGQPQLLVNLQRSRDLGDRVNVRTLLRPFTLEETASYISHRLTASGALRTIFEDDAMEAIHELTQGVPRSINRLCDLALLIGFADEKALITATEVEAVSSEMVSVSPE